jgi:hypothetical protein
MQFTYICGMLIITVAPITIILYTCCVNVKIIMEELEPSWAAKCMYWNSMYELTKCSLDLEIRFL